ncbi:integrin beta 8 [Streptosporangium becharense]|uniref:Integrin beta 8 n=1 Tax=Streptosporangium becharense TaxID=1816182 RepID=A0A7W9MHP1_9ACTN|nr:DUF4190 domain-containing protein [Streptosporangium becharense]MBB2912390.1 integrin beta 8 [Streptosporangium becharense]MBB5820781.1 integrin beta 8 [Streptosporangium becharense]
MDPNQPGRRREPQGGRPEREGSGSEEPPSASEEPTAQDEQAASRPGAAPPRSGEPSAHAVSPPPGPDTGPQSSGASAQEWMERSGPAEEPSGPPGASRWEPPGAGGTPAWEPSEPTVTPAWEPVERTGTPAWEPSGRGPTPGWESSADERVWPQEPADRPSATTPAGPGEPGEPTPWSPEPDEPDLPERPSSPVPEEPSLPRHPDQPRAPEVPGPQQVDPNATMTYGSPGYPRPDAAAAEDRADAAAEDREEERPAHPVPGATPPAYPGWESAAEPAGGPGPSGIPASARPSRYDPPTVPEGVPDHGDRDADQDEHDTTQPGHLPGQGGTWQQGPPPAGRSYPSHEGTPPRAGEAHPEQSRPGEPHAGEPYSAQPRTGGESYADRPPAGGPYAGQPMPGTPVYPGGTPYPAYPGGPAKQGGGLGTAALVLGIAGILLLVVCGIGVLPALVGLIIGIVAVAKGSNKGRAWVGIVLSVLTLVLAAVFVAWVYNRAGDCLNLPPQLQQRCIEDRFGVQIETGS